MSVKIVFRLGESIPGDEVLDNGEPIYDPSRRRLGIGGGNAQPYWYPGIDPNNQDLVMLDGSMIQNETDGRTNRFGWIASGLFRINIGGEFKFRVNSAVTIVYNRLTAQGGGTLSGDFDTADGRFTSMNIKQITINDATDKVLVKTADGVTVGTMSEKGITSKAQSDAYIAMAMQNESHVQMLRNLYSSGFISSRAYDAGRPFDVRYKLNTGGFGALSAHNHPNWRGLCGLAEISAMVNGYFLQTRHVDYRLMHPVKSDTFGERILNNGPPLSSVCAGRPTGYSGLNLIGDLTNTQVDYMRKIWTEHPDECVYELSYLEMWLQVWDGNIMDIATSTRHSNEDASAQANLEALQQYARAGFKLPIENIPNLPAFVYGVDDDGFPLLCYLNWRISSIPVASMSTHNAQTTMDGITYDLAALPYDPVKAAKGIVDATNRFKVRRNQSHLRWFKGRGRLQDLTVASGTSAADFLDYDQRKSWLQLTDDARTMFDCEDLEKLCRKCPGFDGIQNYDAQYMNDPGGRRIQGTRTPITYSSPDQVGLNYYNNVVLTNTSDASGLSASARDFGDINLFTAKTNHPEVVGGFTFMIPLELIVRTPRDNWNPLNVANQETPTGNGTATAPYSGWNDFGLFFKLPADYLAATVDNKTSAADTSNLAYMATPSGTKQMLASGVNIFDYDPPPSPGMPRRRRRFAVVPDATQFTAASRELEYLKMTMKGLLKKVAAGTITGDEIDDAI